MTNAGPTGSESSSSERADPWQIEKNSRRQAWITLLSYLLIAASAFMFNSMMRDAGAPPPPLSKGGRYSLAVFNSMFVVVCFAVLSSFRLNNGERYDFKVFGWWPARKRTTDIGLVTGVAVATVVWGELWARPAITAEVVATLAEEFPGGGYSPPVTPGDVVMAFYIAIGIMLVLHVIGLFANPYDTERYRRRLAGFFPRRWRGKYR